MHISYLYDKSYVITYDIWKLELWAIETLTYYLVPQVTYKIELS